MLFYHPTEQRSTATNTAAASGAWERSPDFSAGQGARHPPGWVVVAGRGVLLVIVVVVVVEVVVEVVVVVFAVVVFAVVVFAVVVFAVVLFAVFTRCGRSYADKQREELGCAHRGNGGVPCQPAHL